MKFEVIQNTAHGRFGHIIEADSIVYHSNEVVALVTTLPANEFRKYPTNVTVGLFTRVSSVKVIKEEETN